MPPSVIAIWYINRKPDVWLSSECLWWDVSSYFWGCSSCINIIQRSTNCEILLWKAKIYNNHFCTLWMCILWMSVSVHFVHLHAYEASCWSQLKEQFEPLFTNLSSLRNTEREVTAQVFLFVLEVESLRRAFWGTPRAQTCIMYVCYEHNHSLTFFFFFFPRLFLI